MGLPIYETAMLLRQFGLEPMPASVRVAAAP